MKKILLCLFLCLNCLCYARLEEVYNIHKTQYEKYVVANDDYGNGFTVYNPEIIKATSESIDVIVSVILKKGFKIIKHENFYDYELIKLSNDNKVLCYILSLDNKLCVLLFNINNKKELKNFINYIHANTNELNNITLDVEIEII